MLTIYLDKVTFTNIKHLDTSRDVLENLEKVIGRSLPEQEYLELTESEIDSIISHFKSLGSEYLKLGSEYLKYVCFFEKMKSVQLEDNQELRISIW